MTNPFETTVGLKGVTPGNPVVIINDIPGISTELVTAMSNDDAVDAAEVWAKVQRHGYEKLVSGIESELSKSADFQYMGVKTGDLTGDYTGLIIVPEAKYIGYSMVCPVASNDELILKSLSLDCANEQDVSTTIKVFTATGKELISVPVTVKPDFNDLLINFVVPTHFGKKAILFVGIDATNLILRTLGTGQTLGEPCSLAYGLDAAAMDVASAHNVGATVHQQSTGVMLNAYVRRSLADVVTRYAERLMWCYANICASLLMTQKLGNDNVNLFTNTNRAYTEEREAKLMDEAMMLVKPVARDILKELSTKQQVVDKADRVFDPGYSQGGFV